MYKLPVPHFPYLQDGKNSTYFSQVVVKITWVNLKSRYPRELPAVVEILSSLLPNNVATSHVSPWHTGNWYIWEKEKFVLFDLN